MISTTGIEGAIGLFALVGLILFLGIRSQNRRHARRVNADKALALLRRLEPK